MKGYSTSSNWALGVRLIKELERLSLTTGEAGDKQHNHIKRFPVARQSLAECLEAQKSQINLRKFYLRPLIKKGNLLGQGVCKHISLRGK